MKPQNQAESLWGSKRVGVLVRLFEVSKKMEACLSWSVGLPHCDNVKLCGTVRCVRSLEGTIILGKVGRRD